MRDIERNTDSAGNYAERHIVENLVFGHSLQKIYNLVFHMQT